MREPPSIWGLFKHERGCIKFDDTVIFFTLEWVKPFGLKKFHSIFPRPLIGFESSYIGFAPSGASCLEEWKRAKIVCLGLGNRLEKSDPYKDLLRTCNNKFVGPNGNVP